MTIAPQPVVTMDAGDLPAELTYSPVPLVALFGLNAAQDEIHAALWAGFTLNRQYDRLPLYFKLLSDTHTFPIAKPKKSSYEWHMPKGILKTRWIAKHLFELPAVAVLFVDLDWDDPQWNEKRIQCIARVEQVRRQLSNRNTKIALVLIQKSSPLPADDSMATERATLLCNNCDLTPNSLFVLPFTDDSQHLLGFIQRMESAFFELSKVYYQQELKTVKSHRDNLNKTTHQLLFVRHQFKMAFLSELKQDPSTAVKHYKQAYAHLMEVRATVINLFEIKTIAGYITYKICKLSFLGNDPLDAISQFRKHIDIFKSKSEPREIEFEHCAWVSKQFSVFGTLFENAVASGLIPSQTQHPGYYFYEAATDSVSRRRLFNSSKNFDPSKSDYYQQLLSTSLDMEFIGQRPWRPGCQTLEPVDMEKENEGVKALQWKESLVTDLSTVVITLLSSAATHFKKNKCLRMKRYMTVLIAEEYFYNGEYANVLTFLNQVLPFYRQELWSPIVASTLTTALKAAYLTGNESEFLKLGLEFTAERNSRPVHEKEIVQQAVINVLNWQPPGELPTDWGVNNVIHEDVWSRSEAGEEVSTLRMDSILPFLDIRVRFAAKQYFVKETISLDVFLVLNAPQELQLSKLQIIFANQQYNQFCELPSKVSGDGSSVVDLTLQPGKVHKFSFTLSATFEDIGRNIEISGVSASLGIRNAVMLTWPATFLNDRQPSPWYERKLISASHELFSFFQTPQLTSVFIAPPPPSLGLQVYHEPPAYLNEIYRFRLNICNNEDTSITDLQINVTCKTAAVTGETVEDGTSVQHFSVDGVPVPADGWLPVRPELTSREICDLFVDLETAVVGRNSINFTVRYNTQDPPLTQDKPVETELETVFPFSFTFTTLSVLHNPVRRIRASEPFILKIVTKLEADGVDIVGSDLFLNETASIGDPSGIESHASPVKQVNDEEYLLHCASESPEAVSLGHYTVDWRRSDADAVVQSKVLLPEVVIHRSFIYVHSDYPRIGVTRTPVQLRFTIFNRTSEMVALELSMGNSDNFMYSGNKQVKLHIAPHASVVQYYMLYPLVCGFVTLPKLRLVAYPDTAEAKPLDDILEDILPAFMQIMPQAKTLKAS